MNNDNYSLQFHTLDSGRFDLNIKNYFFSFCQNHIDDDKNNHFPFFSWIEPIYDDVDDSSTTIYVCATNIN